MPDADPQPGAGPLQVEPQTEAAGEIYTGEEKMAKIFYEKDGNLAVLKKKTIVIVGYGSQGHAHAQNLRDSGLKVVVSEVKGTPNYLLARKHGFSPMRTEEAVKMGDIVWVLIPDEIQKVVYEKEIAPFLKKGVTLGFSHGFNIHFGYIKAPRHANVIMVAPKGPGHLVRSEFVKGAGVPCLVAVERDATGEAWKITLAYCKGIGGLRAGTIRTTYKDETETDLLGEQAVLCGGVSELVKAGFETLVKGGYPPELAYFECMHELKLIVDLFYQGGLSYMWYSVSNTAEYGGLTRGKEIVNVQSRRAMKKLLRDIQSGKFAAEWIKECAAGKKKFKKLEARDRAHLIEKTGRKLRRMMKWIEAK